MANEEKHISNNQGSSEPHDFFKKVEIPFSKTKEEVWDAISEKLSDQPVFKSNTKVISITWFKVAAAVVILLVSTTVFLKLYTTTIYSEKGIHLGHILPDGSTVELNAASSISYHPYWWNFNRQISFEGEAYFKVEKGKSFIVRSENGATEVLGTSFNIYARKNNYKVFCETGKVKVSSTTSKLELLISPGEMAVLDNNNKLGKIENTDVEDVLGWKHYKFNFTSEFLQDVIEELERQYNLNIILEIENKEDFLYTGFFTKTKSVEITLEYICKSFNLSFVKLNEDEYKVLQNNI